MSTKRDLLKLALVVWGALGSTVSAASPNDIRTISVNETSNGASVAIACDAAPVYSVIRLQDPDRLVVDVANASVTKLQGHYEGAGAVTGVVASQFREHDNNVGRILVGLKDASSYDVKAVGSSILVAVNSTVSLAMPSQGHVVETPPSEAPAPRHDADSTIVASRIDEQVVEHPARKLLAVGASRAGLQIQTDGEVSKFEVMELSTPDRLAIDLHGISGKVRFKGKLPNGVRDVRIAPHDGRVRVVMEFQSAPQFDVRRTKSGLNIAFGPRDSSPAVAAPSKNVEKALDETKPLAVIGRQSPSKPAEVIDLAFKESLVGGAVELKLKGTTDYKVDYPDSRSAVLSLEGARIAKSLEKSLDTSDLNTPVKMVSVFAIPGATPRVRVVVAASEGIEDSVKMNQGALTWTLKKKGAVESTVVDNKTAGFATEAVRAASEGAAQASRGYVGKRVSFEFKDIDIHNLLRIISEIAKKNLIVSDDVSGKVTVRLRNVPWDQALDVVLRMKGLGKEEFGNIVRVAPLATLEAESKQRLERKKNEQMSRELSVALIPVNYATAGDMNSRVKEVLSDRGNVGVDQRTNTLIVRDLPENIAKVRSLVSSLDLQTPQVLIEGRIVEASTRIAREVGIQWGGQSALSAATGNPTGLLFPNTVVATGGIAGGNQTGTGTPAQYAVSLPVGAGDGQGGAMGFTFGSVGGAVQLNLRLSALESQGSIKTISAPRITTLDNESAKISQGVSIPFSQVSAAGANTSFMEARLSLDVTPHITSDGSILMKINAQNNQPDPSNSGAMGQPGISRKEASTNVLVKDGETTVIGGIYVRTGSWSQSGLPLLSKIPVLGFFFRNSRELDTKNELLIFITPRILNRQPVAQNP